MCGDVQDTVLVVLEHVEHVAFTTFLCYLATAGESLVLGVLQLFLQLVDFYQVLLDAVSVGDVYDDEEHDQDEQPYLSAYDVRRQDVTTQYLSQREIG